MLYKILQKNYRPVEVLAKPPDTLFPIIIDRRALGEVINNGFALEARLFCGYCYSGKQVSRYLVII